MKIVVFWENAFPCVETLAWTREGLLAAIEASGLLADGANTARFVGYDGLAAALSETADTVLLTPYGSAFPKVVWPVLSDFLQHGGSWVNLGGAPLTRPVRRNRDGSYQVEVGQTAYLKELLLNQAFPIDLADSGISSDAAPPEETGGYAWQWQDDLAHLAHATVPPLTRAWALQPRFTDTRDFPQEHGSGGTRDAALQTQCYVTLEGRRIAAPIVVIDRLHGRYAGGTWALVNAELTAPLAPELLRALLERAAHGTIECEIRPTFACYAPGEQPAFNIRIKAPRLEGKGSLELRIGDRLCAHLPDLPLGAIPVYRQIALAAEGHPESGLTTVTARLLNADGKLLREVETGFWRDDPALFRSARPLTLNRDYFERDGEPYPVMGTTYMAGDTHRKFLFEPNPAVWDRDFAAMQAAGVNMVRTGLWTGWKRVMLDPGALDEGVLRAFTAFLLTARKYDIPVIFNLFAFTPEAWGGSNPYLDPRAVAAQKELVAAFAHRFAHVDDLIWDFINEPSVTSPARIWSTRPNYDAFERAAWAKWLAKRAADFSEEETQAADPADVWRERWRLTPNAPLDLPALADFQDQYIFQGTHPLRVLDYRLFAQEAFTDWVRQMVAVVRSNGNPHQLVTVGQDEGGTGDRPNPHFHADAVDFTTNHSWWQNDDLLWDSVMTKTPGKPNLIQETGIIFVENLDGGFRRTPEACADLLTRKLTLAFAAGCAGAIQWLWNTNVSMDSDNEVGIGFLRADGTEKPELEAFRGLAQFFRENRRYMVGRKLEETVLVIPHSNLFSVRNTADAATRRVVRTFEYDLGVPLRTVSEYRLTDIGDPKLIVLPSPRVLTETCWQTLLAKVAEGATLFVTGPLDSDEYGRPTARLSQLDSRVRSRTQPVVRSQTVLDTIGIAPPKPAELEPEIPEPANSLPPPEAWQSHRAIFGGDKIQKLDTAVVIRTDGGEDGQMVRMWQHGHGKLIYCPVPVELADNADQVLTPLYRAACLQAKVQTHPLVRPAKLLHQITFETTKLFLAISESDQPETVLKQSRPTRTLGSSLAGQSCSVSFTNNQTGKSLANYPEGPHRKE